MFEPQPFSATCIPLVVSITGHRDPRPEQLDSITRRITSELSCLLDNYPDTPISVLSALAEGVDRLAAQATLDLRHEFPGRIRLICPLPLNPDAYSNDWADNKQAQQEFEHLLEQSDECFVLPCDANRPECYAHLGHYLARVSHILLACWDGVNLYKAGGTDRVIDERLNGRSIHERFESCELLHSDYFLPPAELLDEPETGPVLHIPCPRQQSSPSPQLPESSQWIFPKNTSSDEWRMQWKLVNQFNAEIRADNLKTKQPTRPGEESDKNILAILQDRASNVAGVYQYKTHSSMTLIGLFTGLAASILLYAEEVTIPATIWIPCYGLFALLAIAIGHREKINKDQEKHLDYRALSEGLRVQAAWKQAGLHTPASFFYLRKQRRSLAWVRSAIRALAIGEFTAEDEKLTIERLTKVHHNWIRDQKSYYESKVKQAKSSHQPLIRNLGHRIKTAQRLKRTLLLGGGSAFVLSWIGAYVPAISSETPWHTTFVILMAFLPALAVALDYYMNKQAWSEELNQYERMYWIFAKADAFFDNILKTEHPDKKLCAAVLLDLGKEALQEQGDWYQLHHERLLYKGVVQVTKG